MGQSPGLIRPASGGLPVVGAARDCWNRIGVQGDGSCPELVRHVHCRNCPVFSAAADDVLDRQLPSDHLSLWTAHYAAAAPPALSDLRSVVIFRLGGGWLALPTRVVEAVVAVRPVHSLPHRRDGAELGLVNVGGELLVFVALGKVIGPDRAADPTHAPVGRIHPRFLVLRRGASRYVARVDEVFGMHRFSGTELVQPPETLAGAALRYTEKMLPWAGKTVGCLDDELLFRTLDRSLA